MAFERGDQTRALSREYKPGAGPHARGVCLILPSRSILTHFRNILASQERGTTLTNPNIKTTFLSALECERKFDLNIHTKYVQLLDLHVLNTQMQSNGRVSKGNRPGLFETKSIAEFGQISTLGGWCALMHASAMRPNYILFLNSRTSAGARG